MRLKQYQDETLETLSKFLRLLGERQAANDQTWQAFNGSVLPDALRATVETSLKQADPLGEAWRDAQKEGFAASDQPWTSLTDGTGCRIPAVCLKLPTGGGKTLLAAHGVERLQVDWLKRQTGLVLWIVPSQAIYAQTLAALKNRESALRRTLDRASAGRTRVLEKMDRLTRADTQSRLCVMVLMLQAARRKDETVLKMFQGGGDASFFPDETDKAAIDAAKAGTPNLDGYDTADSAVVGSIKRTLANVIRLLRPVVVLDEAHNAMTELGHKVLSTLNPCFILELTATPTAHSNVLVDVRGLALRNEEMIKLPINVAVDRRGRWQDTLRSALDKLNELDRAAQEYQAQAGDYIRPMMVVRVDYTGAGTRERPIHVEDAFEWLVKQGGLSPDAIRRQTADKKELGDENLMSPLSGVRAIVTKDALREGWDAPFAYVLAILSDTGRAGALTQFVGRVLRQPYAHRTEHRRNGASLDEAYVFCTEKSVAEAVQHINAGLTGEGMNDLATTVRVSELGVETAREAAAKAAIRRAAAFRDRRVLTPRVLHADKYVAGGWRELDYEADILASIDWEALKWKHADTYEVPADGMDRQSQRLDLNEANVAVSVDAAPLIPDEAPPAFDRVDLVRRLAAIAPNPWQADRILSETLAGFEARGKTLAEVTAGRLTLVAAMTSDLKADVDAMAKEVFRKKVTEGIIVFRLMEPELDHELRDAVAAVGAAKLRNDRDSDLQRAFYTPVLTAEVNGFERDVALWLDEQQAVACWWRVAARRDQVGLQGWRPHKIYPDFLVSLEAGGKTARLLVLETKGGHLKGNEDTTFKQELFEQLERSYANGFAIGQVDLWSESPEEITFQMLFGGDSNDAWKSALTDAVSAKGRIAS